MSQFSTISPQSPLSDTERALLHALARQTGADPAALEAGYRSGDLQALISALPENRRAAAMQAAHDPQMAETARRMAESGGLNSLFGRQK